MSARILVVDDKENIRKLLAEHLASLGYEVDIASGPQEAIDKFRNTLCEIVITDMRMPSGTEGLEILQKVKEINPDTEVIVVTAFADTDDAINAMKMGAADYLKKPFKLDDIETAVQKVLLTRRLVTENRILRREVEKKYNFSSIIGRSDVMKNVFSDIQRAAPHSSTVLITGDTGTGKELVAWALHDNSLRRERSFVVVNCAAIPSNLLESELFGHVQGAFTDARHAKSGRFEDADGGTIFLDEVAELDINIQVKLLRVLQNGEMSRVGENRTRNVDVRVIAATNVQLEKLVESGAFRKDLFYRLNVLLINIPPLRDRRDDIPLLLRHFTNLVCDENKLQLKTFTESAINALLKYDWPGNVRELHNVVERCVLMTEKMEITESDLPVSSKQAECEKPRNFLPMIDGNLNLKNNIDVLVQPVEKELILLAIEKADGSREKAAELLGISRRSLFYKLKEYGI